jgi:hypothetical protein
MSFVVIYLSAIHQHMHSLCEVYQWPGSWRSLGGSDRWCGQTRAYALLIKGESPELEKVLGNWAETDEVPVSSE